MSYLAVNEIFGPTIQGEGVNLGKLCVFLRLAGCNLSCIWCDTPYAWDFNQYDRSVEVTRMTVDEVLKRLTDYRHLMSEPYLVITGGEPMLQQGALLELTKRLHARGWYTSIETAGTIVPDTLELVKHWTISPKLQNSQNPFHKRYVPDALRKLSLATSREFKYVITSDADFPEIDKQVIELGLKPVYIMPEGTEAWQIVDTTENVIDQAIKRGYNVTTRLQIIAYGNTRGAGAMANDSGGLLITMSEAPPGYQEHI